MEIQKLIDACNARYNSPEDKLWGCFMEYLKKHDNLLSEQIQKWLAKEDYETAAKVIATTTTSMPK